MKTDLQKLLIAPNSTIKDALEILTLTKQLIVFTMDETGRVTGCITDGDIRRGFLRGETLTSPVDRVSRKQFISAKKSTPKSKILQILRKNGIRQIPILDDEGRMTDLKILDDFILDGAPLNTPAVIMAGGKGTRLLPFTETVPKPLLRVGDKTIIETLISNFHAKGVNDFYITVNYLADQIIGHLGNGERFGCHIEYVHETKALGTAGSLALLREKLDTDFIVINGDVLATTDLNLLTQFHAEHKAAATVCAKIFSIRLPYGVVNIDNGSGVKSIEEKPSYSFTVNSGIYCLSPEVFEFIENDALLDMPTLLNRMIEAKKSVKCFQSTEPWIDVGSHDEFQRAQKYFEHLTTK